MYSFSPTRDISISKLSLLSMSISSYLSPHRNYPFDEELPIFKCEEEWIKFNLSIVIIVQMIILLDQKLDLPEDFSWDITVFMISPLESEKYCQSITPVLHFPWLFA